MRKLPSTEILSDIRISSDQVKKKISDLKISSAPGPDGITPRLLKLGGDSISAALAYIFNKSLESGDVPEDWKVANVTPIFKKGGKGDPGNYRPVSLTSIPCKILEACIKDVIVNHLVSQSLIKNSQHGFMKNRSCTTNLLSFLERLTKEQDQANSVDIAYLDFSKAFDKVPHDRLIEKLRARSVEGSVLRWIKNWLHDRRQRTVLNGVVSDWGSVSSGVPQGSVLGPLAFVVFIDDLDDSVDEHIEIINKFADDTKVANIIKSPSDSENMQKGLDKLLEWATNWGMSFNISKCHIMHVGRNNPRTQYFMDGKQLQVTEVEKDIGVKVQSSLRPSAQCIEAAHKANIVLGQITRAFSYRDKRTFVSLYKQYVRPHLEFAVPAWSPWTAGDIALLEKVQMRALKMASGMGGKSYEQQLSDLDLLSLHDRRIKFDLVQTFKIVHGFDKVDHKEWFEMVGCHPGRLTRATSDPLNIVKKHSNNEVRKNFFSNRVVEKWNNLPADVKRAKKVSTFKNSISELIKLKLI